MITISHTHVDGTQLTGSRKGDGVYELALQHRGWRWGRRAGIYLQNSRDKDAQTWKIGPLVEQLRAAGHEVTVDVDNTWRPAAEREADRADRVDARIDRLGQQAGLAAGRSAAAAAAHDRIADGIPFGQPKLRDHHSYGRACRDEDRMNSLSRRQYDEADKATHLAARATGAGSNEDAKHDPRAIARRLEVLEKEVRDWQRRRDASTNPEYHARCDNDIARLTEDITHQRAKLAAMAESGEFVAWTRADFQPGDWAKVSGTWRLVKRSNAKSVSVVDDYGHVGPAKFDQVGGRRRGGQQWDTPNGEPWPVELAVKVARWKVLLHVAARTDTYDDESMWQRIHVDAAHRLILGLPVTASEAEVAAFPAPADVAGRRALAGAAVDVFDRLEAGELVPDVAATLTPVAVEPSWRMPAGEPTDVRAPFVQRGDIVKGMWQSGFGGRELWPHFAGPVASVSAVEDRRERGQWVTITLEDGTTKAVQTHVWLAVYPRI